MSHTTNNSEHIVLDDFSYIIEHDIHILTDSINMILTEKSQDKIKLDTLINLDKKYSFLHLSELNLRKKPAYKNYISKSQNWIGYITEINENEQIFFAKLEDLNNPTTHEIAEFDFQDVSPGDLELLKLGAIFFWSVGYASQNGQIIKQSLLRFKRAVEITEDEFNSLSDQVNSYINKFTWE